MKKCNCTWMEKCINGHDMSIEFDDCLFNKVIFYCLTCGVVEDVPGEGFEEVTSNILMMERLHAG